jgi:hypothetical protein
VIAREIVDDLEAALEQFRLIAGNLGKEYEAGKINPLFRFGNHRGRAYNKPIITCFQHS